MKSFFVGLVLFSSQAFAYEIVCDFNSNYHLYIGEEITLSYNGLPSHPEMAIDAIIDHTKIVQSDCAEICYEIPFKFPNDSKSYVLKINNKKYARNLYGVITDSEGNSEAVYGSCYKDY